LRTCANCAVMTSTKDADRQAEVNCSIPQARNCEVGPDIETFCAGTASAGRRHANEQQARLNIVTYIRAADVFGLTLHRANFKHTQPPQFAITNVQTPGANADDLPVDGSLQRAQAW
jgi:hypothetical protein